MGEMAMNAGRRRLLRGMGSLALGLGAAAVLPSSPALAALARQPERKLNFLNLHTGERVRATYWADGSFVPDGLAEIDKVLRDFRTGEVMPIDRALLDQLVQVRTLVDRDPSQEISVISGFRSHATNEALRSGGGAVAKRSQHQLGRAVDLRMSGVGLDRLHKAALSLQAGGVGYYPQAHNNFVHIDTGPVRTW